VKAKNALKYPEIVSGFNFGRWADHMHTRRWKSGLTTRQMGKIVDVSASMISRWENRKSIPTVPDFLFICDYFDMNPSDYIQANASLKTKNMFASDESIRQTTASGTMADAWGLGEIENE
jgi:transcriptional regulator with XRE-family HTH domain